MPSKIARALQHRPCILFLDEPIARLDPQTCNQIWEFIRKLCRDEQVTVFFTTHYMEEAERVADRIAVIDHGRIVAEGTPATLRQETGGRTLGDAFIALTGHGIRGAEAVLIGADRDHVHGDRHRSRLGAGGHAGLSADHELHRAAALLLSSALFPVPELPGAVPLNPLSYGVDGLRGALNGGFAFGAAIDFAVPGGVAAILLALGAWLFSKIEVKRRHAEQDVQKRMRDARRRWARVVATGSGKGDDAAAISVAAIG